MEEKFMKRALALAKRAYAQDEVPIGAVVVKNGEIISSAFNKREKANDATAHAEILAISKACKKLGDFRLADCDIYVTLEPCTMCMGAILNARIKNVFFGAYANKQNVLSSEEINERAGLNHKTTIVGGVLKEECERLVKDYFADKRK
ncbi:MAG: nucleoside deaminase [Clostridia bacterium]|nr:nucleoside deaminase [Clostridia bacterium]